MEDGNIPLSNSEAERSIRDFAVLRHSTASGFASIKGAESVAFSFIIVATIKFVVIIKEFLCHLKLQGMLFHSKKRLF